jgi:hypothetical protein
MNRTLALACLLLFAASLPLLAQPEIAPTPQPIPEPAQPAPNGTALRKFNLKFLPVIECLNLFRTPQAQGGMKEAVPEGVDIIGLVGLNALMVRAKNAVALDAMAALIKQTDTPEKHLRPVAELVAIELSQEDAAALLAQFKAEPPDRNDAQIPAFDPWMDRLAFQQEVKRLLDNHLATISSVTLTLQSAMSAVVDFHPVNGPYNVLLLSDMLIGKYVTFRVQGLTADKPAANVPTVFRGMYQGMPKAVQYDHVIQINQAIMDLNLRQRLTFLVLLKPEPAPVVGMVEPQLQP